MVIQIFISHSFHDIKLIGSLKAALNQKGIKAYVAEADPKYGENLPNKIQKEIEESDAVIALLTKEANVSPSVNQEIGYAKKAGKKIIPIVEEGVDVGVLLQGYERLTFSLDKVEDTFNKVSNYINKVFENEKNKVFENEKERNELMIIIMLVAAMFLLFLMAL